MNKAECGALGGLTTRERHGLKHYSEIGKYRLPTIEERHLIENNRQKGGNKRSTTKELIKPNGEVLMVAGNLIKIIGVASGAIHHGNPEGGEGCINK